MTKMKNSIKKHPILFDNEQFNRLFPFHILIDEHMKIMSFGKSLGKICVLGGEPLFNSVFFIKKPKVEIFDIEGLKKLVGHKILLRYKEQKLISLLGQFEYFPEQEQVLFVGFPSFNSIEELKIKKLTPQDFAIHNPIMTFLEVMKNQMAATKDVKELLITVDRQKESLTGINEFAANMLNQITLDDIAWTIIDNAISRFNLEDCIIYLVDENGEYLIQRAAYGDKREEQHKIYQPIQIKIGEGIVGKVALTGESVIIDDTSKVPEYIVDDKRRHSELTVPIIAYNKVIGVIDSEHSSKNFFTEQHLIDFTTIANLTAVKIKNALIQEKQANIEETVLRKQKMLQGVAIATEELLTNANLSLAIDTSLRILGKAVGVSRAYIFENTLNSTTGEIVISQSHEWVAKGESSQIKNKKIQNLTTSIFEEFLPHLYSREPFERTISQLEDKSNIKEIFVVQNIKSILIIPIFHRDRFWGFIGYDDCTNERQWPQDELLLLKSFGNSLSSALEITDTTKELKDMALFPLENPNPVVRIDLKGEVILINKPGEVLKDAKGIGDNKKFEERIYKGLSRRLNTENRMESFEISAGKQFYLATARLSETNEYINIYFSNITKQKEVEKVIVRSNKRLKLQEEKYRNIISNMNLGLLEVDNKGIIQFCNQSFTEISGFDLDEIKGKIAANLFFTDHKDGVVQGVDVIHPENTTESLEILTKNKRGEARWWLISLAPNFNDKNQPIGSIGIYLDITKQKRLENELEEALLKSQKASESKELFLTNMSHEIRTPLNGIIGMIRELDKGQMSNKQRGYVNSAKKASRHLLSVVTNILEITKIEAGELQLVPEHFGIQELLDDVAAMLKPQMKHKDISLNINIGENVSEAFIGDEPRIRQILLNLAGNAIKFTEKGEVVIDCVGFRKSKSKQELSFTISDTGIGMDDKYMTTIFKKFQQEDPSISRKFGGTGLGLFITKKLVDLMGGNLQVYSVKGKGTEMQVRLPLPIGTLSIVSKREVYVANESLDSARVLLVEDHEMNRLVAANTLNLLNVEITEATNGLEAVRLLKKETFDLILMDIQMPIMSGMDATKIIRNELKIKTPIIALSANAFKSEIDACMKIGMNDYVTKPYEEQDLLRVVVKHHKTAIKERKQKRTPTEKDSNEGNKPYNLRMLNEMSRGDANFVHRMLSLFVDTTPMYLKQINTFYKENDIVGLKKVAHKIKPSIDNMGITSIKQDVRDIEHFDKKEQSLKDLKLLIDKVNEVLVAVVKQLKEKELV
ncbi:MAG: hypothetical protein COA50_12745 [Flavobacteriaceae bacterium]|nr:MAG: hypothetical protein COA50_12745 [Flavobacteriaceae bacterium]